MPNRIKADSASGLQLISDSSDEIQIQSGTDTVATINSSGFTLGSGKSFVQNTPIFSTYISATYSTAEAVNTTSQFDTVYIDTHNGFNTSNYTYTIPAGEGGIWEFHECVRIDAGNNSDLNISQVMIYVNGVLQKRTYNNHSANNTRASAINVIAILNVVEGDEITAVLYGNTSDNSDITVNGNFGYSTFTGRKLIE